MNSDTQKQALAEAAEIPTTQALLAPWRRKVARLKEGPAAADIPDVARTDPDWLLPVS